MNSVTAIVEPAGIDCNLRCVYCFYHNLKRQLFQSKLMNDHVLECLIKNMFSYNQRTVRFIWHGGEPTLAPIKFYMKVVELQKKYKKPNHIVKNSIQTNGTLLNEDWIKFFKKNNFGIGLSIDGPKELHDKYRPGSFDRLKKSINLLKKNNMKFGVICVVNSENVKFPKKVYEFFRDLKIGSLSIKPCIDLENDELTYFSVNPIDYANFMNKIFDLWMQDDNPNFVIKQFQNVLLPYFKGIPQSCTNQKCACMHYITVDYDGQIYSCDDFHDDFQNRSYGNITQSNIQSLLESQNANLWKHNVMSINEKCNNCEFIEFCGGGCANMKMHLTEKYNLLYCQSVKIMINYICKVAGKTLQKQNQ